MAAHGPSDAPIRQLKEADVDRAFAEHPEERSERGSGSAGSVAGVRVGEKGGQQGMPDIRQIQIAAERAAKRASGRGKATGAPAAKPPQAPTAAPLQADLADWEQEAEQGAPDPAAAVPQAPAVAATPSPEPLGVETGDILDRAARAALKLLAQIPTGMELYVGSQLDTKSVEMVMGLGYLVGKGLAHYRGNSHYRISNAGIGAFIEDKV